MLYLRVIENLMLKIKKIYFFALYLVGMFLFWFLVHPEALSLHEQCQMFLFDLDYMLDRLSVAGGLADYISEFLVQFCFVDALGAALLTTVFGLFQWLVWRSLLRLGCNDCHYVFSFLPALLMLAYMGDENVLWSFPVAFVLVLALLQLFKADGLWHYLMFAAIAPLAYWLAGPVALVLVALLAIENVMKAKRKLVALAGSAVMVIYSLVAIKVISIFFMSQYVWPNIWGGVNYHRTILTFPPMQFVIMAVVALLPLLVSFLPVVKKSWVVVSESILTVALCGWLVFSSYDPFKYEHIKYNYLIRNERWTELIHRAEKFQPNTDLSATSVNLALAMTGQLGERLFEFYQSGPSGLVTRFDRNMVSCLPSAELFYRLGMINSALRYYYDSQECIMNGRKSGRMSQRVAEGYVVNGRYDVARKYLSDLKKTIFYSDWACEVEACLSSEDKLDAHPTIGRLRRQRYKEDFISTGNMSHMFARLWNQDKENYMAFECLMANIMLSSDMESFYNITSWFKERNYKRIPKHYHELLAMFWMEKVDLGPDFQPSEEYKRLVNEYNTAYLMTSSRDRFLKTKWGKTFWAYVTIIRPSMTPMTGATMLGGHY